MINKKKVVKVIPIVYLGGGIDELLLSIIKTKDNEYYFDYLINDSLKGVSTIRYKHPTIEIPKEAEKAIHIIKKTSLEDIKNLFCSKNIKDNLNLYDFFNPKNESIYLSNHLYEDFLENFNNVELQETTYNNKYIKRRIDENICNFKIFNPFNWAFDRAYSQQETDKEFILNFILNELK